MASEKEQYDFESIGASFAQNLRALRVFNDRIGAVAADHDRSATESFTNAFRSLFPEEFFNEVEETTKQSQGDGEQEQTPDPSPEVVEAKKAEVEKAFEDPAKIDALASAAISFMKAAPFQRRLLRTSVLISLMSYFESLVADLIHAFYIRFPKAMPAEDRMLSLAELREIGSIEEAEAFLVAKEVDSILRESLDSQLGYFVKRPKIDLSPLDQYRFTIIEVDQRRNLYVHNRGKVNRTYLERVDSALIKEYEAEKDKQLSLGGAYLNLAMNTVEVVGVILLQQCWRKWGKEAVASADGFILSATFEALQEERYEFVERVAQYAATLQIESEYNKRAISINHAIALRDSGRTDEIDKCLARYDWSASALNFQIALRSVRGQVDEFYELLPRAVAAREVSKEHLETWPLFRNLRGTERFDSALEGLFKDQQEGTASESD